MRRRAAAFGAAGLLALLIAVCALPVHAAEQAPPPAPAADPAPATPAQGPDGPAPPQSVEQDEAERIRMERERAEREETERERLVRLEEALQAARTDLADAESALLAVLAARNRAAGDRLVAEIDADDARTEVARNTRSLARAENRLERSRADLESERAALGVEAAAAYRSASTRNSAFNVAVEGLTRSRNPREFVRGLGYVGVVLSNRAGEVRDAEDDIARAAGAGRSAQKALRGADADLREAVETAALADAETARQQERLDAALAAHRRRTAELAAFAATQRQAAQAADVPTLTGEAVRLTEELAALAEDSAQVADTVGEGSARIMAGKDGVDPWPEALCPVDGSVHFANDWGFPRSGGRSHEGTDIFAPRGSPVVAMADGTVVRISRVDVGLGGLSVTYAIDGHHVYNAHLDTVADDLAEGVAVRAGQRLGTVGTTGNARGTPPHNHVGVYRPNGAPVNPYPALRRACR